jgi:hypothetical protein
VAKHAHPQSYYYMDGFGSDPWAVASSRCEDYTTPRVLPHLVLLRSGPYDNGRRAGFTATVSVGWEFGGPFTFARQ